MQKELVYDLHKLSTKLDALLFENVEPIYETKQVETKNTNIHFQAILFILIAILIYLFIKYRFQKHMFKDVAIISPFLLLLLLFNYITSAELKQKINFYKVLNYVDLDKLFMQFLVFVVIWTIIGVIYHFITQYQQEIYYEYESQDFPSLHRIFENMYLYSDPQLQNIKTKIQYHSIRQQFIHPMDIPLLGPTIFRNDYNFGMYCTKNQKRIYSSLLRINTFSILAVLFSTLLTHVFAPIIITGCLALFLMVQKKNQSQLYTTINSPYDIKQIANMERGMQNPPYLNLSTKSKSKIQQIIYSKSLNLRILHLLLFTQIYWFSWLFYAHRSNKKIYDYTTQSILIGIGSINISIFVPQIVNILTYTHQLYDPLKIAIKGQHNIGQLFHKVNQFYRSLQYENNRISDMEDKFSMTQGQRTLLRYGFICVAQFDAKLGFPQKLQEYRQKLIDNPDMLKQNDQPNLELHSDDIDDEINSKSLESIQLIDPTIRTVDEMVKIFEQQLNQQLMNINENSKIEIMQLSKISKIIGGNLPLWYHILMIKCYFKVNIIYIYILD